MVAATGACVCVAFANEGEATWGESAGLDLAVSGKDSAPDFFSAHWNRRGRSHGFLDHEQALFNDGLISRGLKFFRDNRLAGVLHSDAKTAC